MNQFEKMIQKKTVSDKEQQTIAYYHQHAQNHDNATKQSFWLQELITFNQLLPRGQLLDIGFGGGSEAAYFIEHGYTYTGIDAAHGMVEQAQKRWPQVTFMVKNLYDLESPPHFDGFWCSAVLLYIPQGSIDRALQAIKSVMKPGALGFISLARRHGTYQQEYFDADMGRYFYLYEQNEFTALLQRNGFVIEQAAIRSRTTHRTWLASWLTFFVRV